MWLAASNALLVFLFGMGALVCWIKWLDSQRWAWYAASLPSFLVAGLSKESFPGFVLLMLAITLFERRKRSLIPALLGLWPFLAITAGSAPFVCMTRVGRDAHRDH